MLFRFDAATSNVAALTFGYKLIIQPSDYGASHTDVQSFWICTSINMYKYKKKNECGNFMHFRPQVNLREINFMVFVPCILYFGRYVLRWAPYIASFSLSGQGLKITV
jgi:hypothetical protein